MSHNSPDVGTGFEYPRDPETDTIEYKFHPVGIPVQSLEEKLDRAIALCEKEFGRIIALLEAQERRTCTHQNTTLCTSGDTVCDQCGTILWMARQKPDK